MFDSKSYAPLINKLALATILIIASSCSNIEKDKDLNEGSIALERLSFFPGEEDEVFIGIPTNAAYSESAVFIPVQASSGVHHFDLKGNYMGQIGRPGRGPGEVGLPGRASFHNSDLWVYDIGNARYWRWSEEEGTLETIQAPFIPRSFVVGDSIIFKTRLDQPSSNAADEQSFISRFDHEMNMIDSFGKNISSLLPEVPAVGSASKLALFDDKLYVLFQNFPFLLVYSKDGQLIRKINFNQRYDELATPNFSADAYSDPSHLRFRHIFQAFDVSNKGISIAVKDEDNALTIDQHDHSGAFIRRFRIASENESAIIIRDLKAGTDEWNNLLFYVFGFVDDEAAVHLFTPVMD